MKEVHTSIDRNKTNLHFVISKSLSQVHKRRARGESLVNTWRKGHRLHTVHWVESQKKRLEYIELRIDH